MINTIIIVRFKKGILRKHLSRIGNILTNNKVIIIDDQIVITGSFNFTKAAQSKNAENLLIINDKNLAETYLKNWNKRMTFSDLAP